MQVNFRRLNSVGPFVMGVWQGPNSIKIGNEESMDGRCAVMAETLKEELTRLSIAKQLNFSQTTVLDIGCHDGWVLNQISHLGFKELTGVEPRNKNIQKGIVVREELGIDDKVKFIEGNLEGLPNKKYDLVVCTGLLYHVESIPVAINKLRDVTKSHLFIESRVVNSKFLSEKMKFQIELNDLDYKNKKETAGLALHKFETKYSDGSADKNTVVTLPSTELLVMYLKNAGFTDIRIVTEPSDFRSKLKRKERPLDGVCILASVPQEISQISATNLVDSIIDFESEYVLEQLTISSSLKIKKALHNKNSISIENHFINLCLQNSRIHNKFYSKVFALKFRKENNKKILGDIKFSPEDKIDFEIGKNLFRDSSLPEAKEIFEKIIDKPNADWRTVYRSLFYLSVISEQMQEPNLSRYYDQLLISCNPNFPGDHFRRKFK
jgi:ubiquinone/menaquinone biosynthesis C-methylase UbiE